MLPAVVRQHLNRRFISELSPVRLSVKVLRMWSLVHKVHLEVAESVRAARQARHVIGIHVGDLGNKLAARSFVQAGVVEQGHALLRIRPDKMEEKAIMSSSNFLWSDVLTFCSWDPELPRPWSWRSNLLRDSRSDASQMTSWAWGPDPGSPGCQSSLRRERSSHTSPGCRSDRTNGGGPNCCWRPKIKRWDSEN